MTQKYIMAAMVVQPKDFRLFVLDYIVHCGSCDRIIDLPIIETIVVSIGHGDASAEWHHGECWNNKYQSVQFNI